MSETSIEQPHPFINEVLVTEDPDDGEEVLIELNGSGWSLHQFEVYTEDGFTATSVRLRRKTE
jgi:hypothetical protein